MADHRSQHRRMERVSCFDLGHAWSGNSLNCTTYRQSGLFSKNGRQAFSFVGAHGRLVVGCRDFRKQSVDLIQVEIPLKNRDAHFSPSIVIDPLDRIHVVGGAHVSAFFYGRTENENLNSFRIIEDIGFKTEEKVSYPGFLNLGEDSPRLLYRLGYPGLSTWGTRSWSEESHRWSDEFTPLLSGSGHRTHRTGPYLNTPLRVYAGRIGFFYVWRQARLPNSGDHVRNIGLDFCELDVSSGRAFAHSGVELPLPISPYVSERVVAVPWGADLSNQAGATRLPDGRPFGVSNWAGAGGVSQVHVFWPDLDGQWHSHPITRFTSRRKMVGRGTLHLPHSRPSCGAMPDGSVLVVFRTSEASNHLLAKRLLPPSFSADTAEEYTLWAEDLGFYEPVLDIPLLEATGRICAYVQHCGDMKDTEVNFGQVSAPAFLTEWRLTVTSSG